MAPLNYLLLRNDLTGRAGDHRAQTRSEGCIDETRLIKLILERGTTIGAADLAAAFTVAKEVIVQALQDGFSLNLPLFNAFFSIKGVFNGPMDTFDPKRHKAEIKITKGILLREAEKKLRPTVTTLEYANLKVKQVKDSFSDVINDTITVGGITELRGLKLKIAGEDPTCGVWFIGEDGKETQAQKIIENKPARIMLQTPNLTPGKYQVKVVTQFGGTGNILNTPRVFVYQEQLTVK